ncbi:MAG: hypothetical protein ACPG4U_01550 [Pseudomonadales bacterium]
MKSGLRALIACVLTAHTSLLWATVEGAEKKGAINWLRMDFAPLEIAHGPFAGKGEIDYLRRYVMQLLPEYEHVDPLLVSQGRLLKLYRKDNYCHAALLKGPQIAKLGYMSVGYSMAFGHEVITTPALHRDKFNGAKVLSLTSLMQREDLILGIGSRTLGPVINEILAPYKGTEKINDRQAAHVDNALIEMIFFNRIDYTLDHQTVVAFWNEANPDKPLVSIELKEMSDHVLSARVTCSKTPFGRDVIRTLNKRLLAQRHERSYIDWLLSINRVPKHRYAEFHRTYRKKVLSDEWTNAN